MEKAYLFTCAAEKKYFYLLLQEYDDRYSCGWDFSLYNEQLQLIEGGQLNNPEMDINAVKYKILSWFIDPTQYEESIICHKDMIKQIDSKEELIWNVYQDEAI